MAVSAAEGDTHQLESRRWQTYRKTGSLLTSRHLPMSVLTVLGPFWFDAGGAKPRERISLLTARAIFINIVHSLDIDSFRKLYASFYGWKGAAIIRSDQIMAATLSRAKRSCKMLLMGGFRKSSRRSSCREMRSGS